MTKTAVHPRVQKTSTLWRCGGRTCRSPEGEGDEKVARRDLATQGPETAPPIVHDVLAAPGASLPPAVRRDAEHRLGHDFSSVRIHQGDDAARSAQAVSARAFTVGRHIVFGDRAFDPGSDGGRRVLYHELVHTMQQNGAAVSRSPLAISSPHDDSEREAEEIANRVVSATPEQLEDDNVHTLATSGSTTVACTPLLQRDFALAPPRPDAVGRVLTPAQMQQAIDFNNRVVSVVGPAGISEIRDVLGISRDPDVIDESFVNAVVQWQAMNRLTQDGQLGPATATRLFREIGAEGAGRGELDTGPTYTPSGTLTPPVVGGRQDAAFRFRATFKNDPANGVFASCCEARQFMRWDAASAAALPGGIPHAGFPAGTAAGTWIEDRNGTDTLRYGHRSGRHGNPIVGNQYRDTTGATNQAFGHIYEGRDFPGGPDPLLAGTWRFMVRVIDVCNGGARLGDDFVRINW